MHVQYRVDAILSSSAQEHRGENLIGLYYTEQSRHSKKKGLDVHVLRGADILILDRSQELAHLLMMSLDAAR